MLSFEECGEALQDLSHYGWCYFNSLENAQQVRRLCPNKTSLEAVGDGELYRVAELRQYSIKGGYHHVVSK